MDELLCRSAAIRQIFRFGTVGGVATLIHTIVATAWLLNGSSSALEANLLGYSAAFTWSFVGNVYWVFKYKGPLWGAFSKFIAVSLCTLTLSVMISLLVDRLDWSAYWAVALIALTVPAVSFIANRSWVFRSADTQQFIQKMRNISVAADPKASPRHRSPRRNHG